MKLCRDCKHYQESRMAPNVGLGKCTYTPKTPARINRVSGKMDPAEYWYAETQRNWDCGPNARWWDNGEPKNMIATDKPKKSGWRRLFD